MRVGVCWRTAAAVVFGAFALPVAGQITVTKVEGGISASAFYEHGTADGKSESLTSAGLFDKTVNVSSTGYYDAFGFRISATAQASASLKALIPNLSGSVIKGAAGVSKNIQPGGIGTGDSSVLMKVTFTADQNLNYVLSYNQSRQAVPSAISLLEVSAGGQSIAAHSYGFQFETVSDGRVETTGRLRQGSTYQLVMNLYTIPGGFLFGSGNFDFTFSVGPAVDVTQKVQITRSEFRYDSNTRTWVQRVTIKNITAAPIVGPISLVLDNLTNVATLKPADGVTKLTGSLGSPYVDFALVGGSLPPDGVATVSLNVVDPTNAQFTYTPRVLAGEGVR